MQTLMPNLKQATRQALSAAVAGLYLVLALAAHANSGASNGERVSVEPAPLLSDAELRELVAPVALYSDELLAIVLPASTYPLQIVAAARYRDAVVHDPDLQPDEYWDESIVALLNYPEALAFLNSDLDWTWSLGQAVTDQQADLLAAVSAYRDEAYAAGNLQSDDKHVVAVEDDVVTITSADPEVIHVPYYEPEEVTIYQTERVYHYYPTPYPVYYYPYTSWHRFYDHGFWGINSAFVLSWSSFHLGHHLHTHYYHPYFGRRYHRNHFRYTSRYISAPAYNKRHRYRSRYHGDDDRWQPDRRWSGHRPSRHERHAAASQSQHRQLLRSPLPTRSSSHRPIRREINSVRQGRERSSVHRPAPQVRAPRLQPQQQQHAQQRQHQAARIQRHTAYAAPSAPRQPARASSEGHSYKQRSAPRKTPKQQQPTRVERQHHAQAKGQHRNRQAERRMEHPQRSAQFARQSRRAKLPMQR